jgi:hypothetical protein
MASLAATPAPATGTKPKRKSWFPFTSSPTPADPSYTAAKDHSQADHITDLWTDTKTQDRVKDKSKSRTKTKTHTKKSKRTPEPIAIPYPSTSALTDQSQVAPSVSEPPQRGSVIERLRPIQFTPNRLQTLYVTPSERNLYLAAMAQLDRSPPPLPLWLQTDSQPSPSLPPIQHQPPISSPDRTGHRPDPTSIDWPTLSSMPRSPKMVTAPHLNLAQGGLMIREEFKRLPPPKSAQHALLALSGAANLRFTGFPVDVLSAVQDTLLDAWPPGLVSVGTPLEGLSLIEGAQLVWRVQLAGVAWKRPGKEELQ